jgi:hypothetical protein
MPGADINKLDRAPVRSLSYRPYAISLLPAAYFEVCMCILIQLTDIISTDVSAATAGTTDGACSAAPQG